MDEAELTMRVTRREAAAADVLLIELESVQGADLPAWAPGAHLELVLPSGVIRHYSLCGDPADRSHYVVSVLRVADGRGGSIELHDEVLVDDTLLVRGPRNHFPLLDADAYLLLAGGIGVTPIVAMVRELESRAADWRLVYGGRSASAMAFHDELAKFGDRVELVAQDQHGIPDLAAALEAAPEGTAVYCCGPEGMLAAVADLCDELGGRASLHVERFGGTADPDAHLGADEHGFQVELRRSGMTLDVPADRTILDVVLDVLPAHPHSCLEGECGSCETRVLDGVVDHRDQLLTAEEQAENSCMMICVSRAAGSRLVLDL